MGYQVVWYDMHLMMVMRMNLRSHNTHLHVAIRFIGKILYWCNCHNNKYPTGLRRQKFYKYFLSQTKSREYVAPLNIILAAASHQAWQVRQGCQGLLQTEYLLPPPEKGLLHLHHVQQFVLGPVHPLWSPCDIIYYYV